MSRKTKLVMVGSAGFANHYLEMLLDQVDSSLFQLEAIVDPYVQKAPRYQQLTEMNIPFYDTLEEFYQKHTADLAIIATPIKFHKSQSITAMEHGSNVLCEKPLVTDIDDIPELREAVQRTGKQMAVGFQWSFSPALLRLKKDIIDGVFGKPLLFQTFTVFTRYDRYFARNNWAGKLYDAAGDLILDSIATNATAHYLHNIFFMLGRDISASAMPKRISASLYKANPVETFDTCFLQGEFEDGCRFQYVTTHCSEDTRQPILRYELEKAVITFDANKENARIEAHFRDGRVIDYGSPSDTTAGYDEKLYFMLTNSERNLPIPCTVDTVVPHLAVCDALFDFVPVQEFPKELIYRSGNEKSGLGSFVKDLYSQMWSCFEKTVPLMRPALPGLYPPRRSSSQITIIFICQSAAPEFISQVVKFAF